jgi:hypothetical protein
MDLPSSHGQHLLHFPTAFTERPQPQWNSTNDNPGDVFDSWISSSARLVLLGTILPGAVVLVTVLWDALSRTPWPYVLRNTGRRLWSPFCDFISLDDLKSELGPGQTPPAWKNRTLFALSALEAAGWATALAYAVASSDEGKTELLRDVVSFVAWVSALLNPDPLSSR